MRNSTLSRLRSWLGALAVSADMLLHYCTGMIHSRYRSTQVSWAWIAPTGGALGKGALSACWLVLNRVWLWCSSSEEPPRVVNVQENGNSSAPAHSMCAALVTGRGPPQQRRLDIRRVQWEAMARTGSSPWRWRIIREPLGRLGKLMPDYAWEAFCEQNASSSDNVKHGLDPSRWAVPRRGPPGAADWR